MDGSDIEFEGDRIDYKPEGSDGNKGGFSRTLPASDMRSICKTFYPGEALRTSTHFRDILRKGKRARRIARIVTGTGSKSELRGDISECSREYEFERKGD